MAAGRKPGPQCAHGNPVAIDDGTMCVAQSPTPGSAGTAIHGQKLAGSVAGLIDLLRIFIRAALYERAQHPSWIVADLPGYLTAKTAQLVFGVQLKKAHDQCEALIRDLKNAVTHPGA